jgi:hypothetical protein
VTESRCETTAQMPRGFSSIQTALVTGRVSIVSGDASRRFRLMLSLRLEHFGLLFPQVKLEASTMRMHRS